ncbi:MAG: AtpZ/AtpI family protein [Ignavibacteriae bacterium]|nr:AtpZ/AtpI family protein [Ignavibacteriota bacterium]
MEQNNKLIKSYKEIGPYLGLGTQLAASIILMFFLGKWLDEKLQFYPILTIIFSFIGGFAGIYNVIKSTIELNKKKK